MSEAIDRSRASASEPAGLGSGGGAPKGAWPEPPDFRLGIVAAEWEGLGDGYGHLRARRVTVEAIGRRGAVRPRRAELWLPAPDGGVVAAAEATVLPLRAGA